MTPIERPRPEEGPPFSSPWTVVVVRGGAKSGARDFLRTGAGESVADSQSEVMEAGVMMPSSGWGGGALGGERR